MTFSSTFEKYFLSALVAGRFRKNSQFSKLIFSPFGGTFFVPWDRKPPVFKTSMPNFQSWAHLLTICLAQIMLTP